MSALYPSSVPEYNQLRFVAPDALDTSDIETCNLAYPRDLRGLLFGAMSLLSEINMLVDSGAVTAADVVDAYNNYVGCGGLNCEEVVECLQGANGLRAENCELLLGDQVIVDLRQCAVGGEEASEDDLTELENLPDDEICGAAQATYDFITKRANDLLDILQIAADIGEAVSDVMRLYIPAGPNSATVVQTLFNVFGSVLTLGIAATRADINDTVQRQAGVCDLYTQILCDDDGAVLPDNVRDTMKAVSYTLPTSEALIDVTADLVDNRLIATAALIGINEPDNVYCGVCAACPPDTILVTFDANNWQDYSVIPGLVFNATGIIESNFGNPAPCARGGRDNNCGFTGGCGELAVRVNLPSGGGAIDTISFDYYTDIAGNWAQRIFVYDAGGSLIETLGGVIVATTGQWVGATLTAMVQQVAAYVIVQMQRTNVSGRRTPFIDNIQINYT